MIAWRKRDLLEATQETVLKCALGIAGVAEHLQKRENTLYKELNPNFALNSSDKSVPKLGFLDWVKIMGLTDDYSTLDHVCKICDRVAVPIPHPEHCQRGIVDHMADDAQAYADHLHALSRLMVACPKKDREQFITLVKQSLRESETLVNEAASTRENLKVMATELLSDEG